MQGSKPGRLDLVDVKNTVGMFLTLFIPVFLTQIYVNLDRMNEIIMLWLQGTGLPEILQLAVVPAIGACFFLIKKFVKDNSDTK